MHLLFVYGTLLHGERNHHYLDGANLVSDHVWTSGNLFDTGNGYPVMCINDESRVYGSVYRVDEEHLRQINLLEGYHENGTNNLYNRITVKIYDETGESFDALTYVAGDLLETDSLMEISIGNWKVYQYLSRESLYYFAYGSCMDDERFHLAAVDHYFKDIVGRGVLENYGFRFSKASNDGGKADIIQSSDEVVEGIIYNVPLEAFDYLYKREGVHTNQYRPEVITLRLHNKKVIDALTFIGMEKNKETMPTKRYATEIIRGATGILSPSYISKIKKRVNQLDINNGNECR